MTQEPTNLTGKSMKSLRDMRDKNRHTKAAFKFLTDLKDAEQVDLDEFGDQKIIEYEIPNTSGTSIEIKFLRNEKPELVNLVAKREIVYSITHKSWDKDNKNKLDNPPDEWKFSYPKPAEPEPAPIPKGSERARRIVDAPIIVQTENMNPKWLLAMKELIYGSR
jgi:hypothetical protein